MGSYFCRESLYMCLYSLTDSSQIWHADLFGRWAELPTCMWSTAGLAGLAAVSSTCSSNSLAAVLSALMTRSYVSSAYWW